MSKFATKAAANMFCQARYEAAKSNDRLSSREGAAEEIGIDRTRLARIELGSTIPYQEEVLLMADCYKAPELKGNYCREMCPLGKNMPKIENTGLDRISLRMLSSLKKINEAKESASISTSSSGSSVSATIAGNANGGEVGLNGAELSWVGEEGLEYIIPTVPARRQRGIELWKSAGRTLGVLGPDDEISAHASGGIVGKEVSNTTPYFDTDSSSQDSEKTEKETVPTNVVSDKSGVVVQVNLSPQFNISDTNDSDVIRLIKAHIKELADDLGSEIATMLSEAYENTPVTT